jgi:hypothetical protein
VKISELKKSRFMTKDDCEPPIKVTIAHISEENVAMENQAPDMRWALNFKEDLKPMILNSINAQIIAQITKSEETDDWPGAVIVLYNDPTVSFGGKITGGIRVRAVRNAPPQRKPAPADFDDAIDKVYGQATAAKDVSEEDVPW